MISNNKKKLIKMMIYNNIHLKVIKKINNKSIIKFKKLTNLTIQIKISTIRQEVKKLKKMKVLKKWRKIQYNHLNKQRNRVLSNYNLMRIYKKLMVEYLYNFRHLEDSLV